MKRNLALLLALTACASTPPAPTAPAAPPTTAKAATPSSSEGGGIDLAGVDRSIAPGDDFFAFANGTWDKTTEIPADRSNWGTGAIVSERTAKRTAEVIADAAKNGKSADARKVGDYYVSFMDEAAIEAKGLEPIKAALAMTAAIGDAKSLARALGGSVRADVDVLNTGALDTPNILGL